MSQSLIVGSSMHSESIETIRGKLQVDRISFEISESAVAVSAIIGMFSLQRARNSPILLNASLNGWLVGESEQPLKHKAPNINNLSFLKGTRDLSLTRFFFSSMG